MHTQTGATEKFILSTWNPNVVTEIFLRRATASTGHSFSYLTTVSKRNADKYINAHMLCLTRIERYIKREKEEVYTVTDSKKFPLQTALSLFSMFWVSLAAWTSPTRGSYSSAHDDAWIYNSLDAPVELSCASIHLYIRSQCKFPGERPVSHTWRVSDMERRPFLTFYIQYTVPFAWE